MLNQIALSPSPSPRLFVEGGGGGQGGGSEPICIDIFPKHWGGGGGGGGGGGF